MVAQVEVRIRDRQRGGEELGDADAAPAQRSRHARAAVAGADAVDQHAHGDAARLRRRQRVEEQLAGAVVIEDVGGEQDRALRRGDGVEHRRIGDVAAVERRHPVAGEERVAGGARRQLHQRLQASLARLPAAPAV